MRQSVPNLPGRQLSVPAGVPVKADGKAQAKANAQALTHAPDQISAGEPDPVQMGHPVPAQIAEQIPAQAPAADHKLPPHLIEAAADPTQPNATSATQLEQMASSVASPTLPSTTTIATTPASYLTSPTSPTEQIGPALLTLAKSTDGSQQMTIRLHPADLGMVQVKIEHIITGVTQIEITADNPATLLALQRDQPQLHRSLDEAGIPAAGRTVTFHVAEAPQAAANSNGSGSLGSHTNGQQGSPNRPNAGTTDADGSAGGGKGSYPARERNTYSTGRRATSTAATTDARTATGTSHRIGLDITA